MNTIVYHGLLLAVLLSGAVPALAQNRYFDGDATGVTTSVGFSSGSGVDGLGLETMVTVRGRLDLGLGLASLNPSSTYSGNTAKNYAAWIAYALKRPGDDVPWGAEAWVQFDWLDFGGRAQSLGLNFFQRKPTSRDVHWVPVVGVGYVWAESSTGRREEGVMFGLGLGIHVENQVFIAPQLVYAADDYSFAMKVGLSFS